MARHTPASGQLRQRPQHRFGTAADKMLRRCMRFEQLCHEAVEAERAIIGSEMDRGTGGAEILDASSKIGGADAIIERNTLSDTTRRPATIAARAQQITDVSEKRRLPDAAGDQGDMVEKVKIGEAVAKRSPYLHVVPGPQRRQQASQLADNEIHHVKGDRLSCIVENRIIQSEGPAQ